MGRAKGVGGQFFGLDFSLETSTPEFPQKGVGDAFGLLSGLFYGLSMFFNGYRKDADTTARGVWNFIFAVLGAGLITIILNSLTIDDSFPYRSSSSPTASANAFSIE